MTEYAIIGDGAAGTTAAFYIRKADPQGRIRIYSDDPNPAYYRAALTNYLMGELRADQLFAVPPSFYADFNVERAVTRVETIDAANQTLHLRGGLQAPYDQLLIAAGARARKPTFPGNELAGVMALRTMQDARRVMDSIQSGELKHAVISGGGILGLEWVAGLRSRGVEVTFVVRESAIMEGFLDQTAADLVSGRCRHFGVDVRLAEEVEEILGRGDRLEAVKLKNSQQTVHAQLLGWAIGIIPNIEFLQGTSVALGRGVFVNELMRTNVKPIYAAGDITEVRDPVTGENVLLGLWEPARHHGRIAGINMTGGKEKWNLETQYIATRLYDLDVAGIGRTIETPTDEVIIDFPREGDRLSYKKLILENNRLVGALLLGLRKEKVRRFGRDLTKLVASGADLSSVKDKFFDPFFDIPQFVDSLGLGSVPSLTAAPVSTAPTAVPGQAAQTLSGLMGPARRGPIAPKIRGDASSPAASPGHHSGAALKADDGRVYEFTGDLVIGRGTDAGLSLNDAGVAPHHAAIRREGHVYVISDLETEGGTYVNGTRITRPTTLHHGATIRVGTRTLVLLRQMLPPRAETGPAGLPAEPLKVIASSDGVSGWLHWNDGDYEIPAQEIQIGRDPKEAEVILDDPQASWLHAEITRHMGRFYLRDLGSASGTFVNGSLVTIPRLLRDGDLITIGSSHITFRTAERGAAQPPLRPRRIPPPPPPPPIEARSGAR